MKERIQKASEIECQAYQDANDSGHVFVCGPFDAPFIVQALSGLSREESLFFKKTPEQNIPEEPQEHLTEETPILE